MRNTQDSEREEDDSESDVNNISPTQDELDRSRSKRYPVIPQPPVVNTQSPAAIRRVKFMEAYLATIPLLPTVPKQWKETWALANTRVYKWIQDVDKNSDEYSDALKWELLLHKILLPSNKRQRGRKKTGPRSPSGDSAAIRMTLFLQGDYQGLINRFQTQVNQVRSTKSQKRGKQSKKQHASDAIQRAQDLMALGRFSKAHKTLLSHGLGDLSDPQIVLQIVNKQPQRREHIPSSIPGDLITPRLKVSLRDRYKKLKPLAGTGPADYRNEYLRALSHPFNDPMANEVIPCHEVMAEMYINADLPDWYYFAIGSLEMVALIKDKTRRNTHTPDVRPIGVGSCKRRAWLSQLMADHNESLASAFMPQQMAVGVKGGMQKMFTGLKIHTEFPAHKHHVVGAIDISNAYQEIERASLLREVKSHGVWKRFYKTLWSTLSPSCRIKHIGVRSDNGVIQGDPISTAMFCAGIHNDVLWADAYLRKVGGFAIFFADDGRFVGPPNHVLFVMKEFERRIQKRLGLRYNNKKCSIWFLDVASKRDFEMHHPECPYPTTLDGTVVAGVPIGTEQFVKSELKKKIDHVLSETKKIITMLRKTSLQNLYALLTYCCNTRVQHLAQVLPPRVVASELNRFDNAITDAAAIATGIDFHTEAPLVHLRLRMPRKLNGGGLRSMADVAPAAYVGGLLVSLPSMIDSTTKDGFQPGILSHITDLFGMGSFDQGNEGHRLEKFISNRDIIQTSADFTRSWIRLRHRTYGEDVTEDEIPIGSLFKVSINAAGSIGDKVYDKVQHRITSERESGRFDRLKDNTINICKTTNSRNFGDIPQHVMAFLSVDRFSQQFVSAPATNVCIMGNDVFCEAWATYMGTPSPSCAPFEGETFPRTDRKGNTHTHTIDKYGNTVTSVVMQGDHWRKRHDNIKHTILKLARWSKLGIQEEVLNLFSLVIKHIDRVNETCNERQIQGMVPDLYIEDTQVLADIKTMTCCKTHYPPARFRNAVQHDAVRIRQNKVHGEYKDKAHFTDVEYNAFTGNKFTGPVSMKLSSFGRIHGLACGAFGEGSQDMYHLCMKIADKGGTTNYQDLGATTAKEAGSRAARYVFRTVGMEMMRGTAALKIHRLSIVQAGQTSIKEAIKRRSQAWASWTHDQREYFAKHSFGTHAHERPW